MGDQTVFRAPGTDAIKLLDGATLAALVFKTAGACDRLGSLFMHRSTALGSTFYERTLFLIAFFNVPPLGHVVLRFKTNVGRKTSYGICAQSCML